MAFNRYRDYFLLGAGVGAFLCYKFYSFSSFNKDSNEDNLKDQRILYNNLSKFNFHNKRPKLLLINSNIPTCQIMNSNFLPKNLDIYKITLLENKNKKSEIYYLNNILGFYGNNIYNINLQKKPIDPNKKNVNIAINSYGDIKCISNETINEMEFNKRIKSKKGIFNFYKKFKNKKSGLSIFDRLNILNDKNKFLKMGNHDFILLYCSKQNKDKIAYSLKEFVIYRYIFRKILKGYNIKFYTKINDYKINELDNNELIDTDNHVYIVQRQNLINKELFKHTETIDTSLPLNHKNVTEELTNFLNKKNLIVKIDNNNFYFTDITKDLDDNYKSNYMNKLITKGNVFYYINNNKNNLNFNLSNYFQELNKCFPKCGYFHIFCNLFSSNHRNQLINFISEYKKNINKVDNNSALLINDCLSIFKPDINILQFFSDKYYDINQIKKIKGNNVLFDLDNNNKIFKKKIFDLKKDPLIWLNNKEVNPDNINFFHEIKYLF